MNANTIRNCLNQGIGVQANDGGGVLNLTVTDNTVDVGTDVNTQQPFFMNAGSTSTNVFGLPDSHTVCLAMTGNTLANGPFVLDDFRVRQRFDTTFRLPGYGGAADDTAAVVAFIAGNNPVSTGSATTAFPTSGAGFVGGAGCTVPIVP